MWAAGASDGVPGFRATLEEIYPTTRTQRCGVHKTATVLNAVLETVQPQAKQTQHEIWQAATSEDAGTAVHDFIATHEAKYPNHPPSHNPGETPCNARFAVAPDVQARRVSRE